MIEDMRNTTNESTENNLIKMQKREFFFFEWVVIDNCNLNCSYCVNKGVFSQKQKDKMVYVPGREIDIALKIVELSRKAERVHVNLTGGEPLLSDHFADVLSILASAGNVTVQLITNLKRIEKYADDIVRAFPSLNILGSLHVHFRSDHEIERLIAFVNFYKDRLHINLSQVNHDLSDEERKRVTRISNQTGLPVTFQTFIPPWTEAGKVKNEKEIMESNFGTSRGKRCCLGYSHFFLFPDGTFHYDLWCNGTTCRKGNFLSIAPENFDDFILNDMKKCLKNSCGCNYNLFNYAEYLAACQRLGYPNQEIFSPQNK
jgi:organic radical activating enzyme